MTEARLDHDKYAAYLNQHLAAADAGVQAFQAAADTWAGTEWEQVFQQLHEELEDSHAEVKQLIADLGYDVSVGRNVVSGLAKAVGRINPLNLTRNNDGKLTQLEIDALAAAVRAQQMMWETLLLLSPIDDRLDPAFCEQMLERCRDQRERVRKVNAETVLRRFTLHPDE